MLCNFYGKVLIEPTTVEHTTGGLRALTQFVTETCRAEGLTDTIVAIEMTGIYHKPVQRGAFPFCGYDLLARSRGLGQSPERDEQSVMLFPVGFVTSARRRDAWELVAWMDQPGR